MSFQKKMVRFAYRCKPWAQKFLPDALFNRANQMGMSALTGKTPLADKMAWQTHSDTSGANIIGYTHQVFGVARGMKNAIESIKTVNIPFVINSYEPIAEHVKKQDWQCQSFESKDNPYAFNLFYLNAPFMPMASSYFEKGFFANRYNIGIWAWETSSFPDYMNQYFDYVHEVWAISDFVRDILQANTHKPVVTMPCAIAPTQPQGGRESFGLPEEPYLFLFIFDGSAFHRKNPMAVIKAFQQAFSAEEQVGLVIKTMYAESFSQEYDALQIAISQDDRIHLIDKLLTPSEVAGLQQSCDSFISLHRAEGFGMNIAEAMALGKPVIATNYSGNLQFMNKQNSLLVDYDLVPIKKGEFFCYKDQYWAEPKIEQAAKHMRQLVDDLDLAANLAQAGAKTIKQSFSPEALGKQMKQRLQGLLVQ